MPKKAVLLLNLGSPDSTEVPDVRAYLKEFLSDPRVLDINPWLRSFILNCFILPKRPRESGEAYETVWTPEGSPLVVTSKRQQALVEAEVEVPVALAMRYGNPGTPDVLAELIAQGVEELLIMPLYPHYAMSSYETAVVQVTEELARQKPDMKTRLLQPFYNHPSYIDALAESARPYLERAHDLLLFSYHGIPQRHVRKTDPSHAHCLTVPNCCETCHPAHSTCYRHQCYETTRLLVEKLGIPKEKYAVSFQSRLLRDPWLMPYTDQELDRFAAEGVKRIFVMTPAFVTDCLETLEEIAIRGKEDFEKAGGEHLELIPCLNEHPAWIRFLVDRIGEWA